MKAVGSSPLLVKIALTRKKVSFSLDATVQIESKKVSANLPGPSGRKSFARSCCAVQSIRSELIFCALLLFLRLEYSRPGLPTKLMPDLAQNGLVRPLIISVYLPTCIFSCSLLSTASISFLALSLDVTVMSQLWGRKRVKGDWHGISSPDCKGKLCLNLRR